MLGVVSGIVIAKVNNPLYILVGFAGLFAFLATVFSLEFGLLVLVFITYTRLSDIAIQYHNAPSIAKSFIALVFLSILFRWAIFKERPRGWERPALLLGAYGLVELASVLYAQNSAYAIDTLIIYLKDAIIAVAVVIMLRQRSTFRRVVWVLLLVGIFLGTLSVFQYVTKTYSNYYWGFALTDLGNIYGSTNDYRIAGPIGDPNFYAQVMVVLAPLAYERFVNEQKVILRVLAAWALITSVLAVVLSFSRGGFLALVVAMVAIVIAFPPKVKYIPILIALAVGLLAFLPSSYYERMITLGQALTAPSVGFRTQDAAIQGRASENLAAWEMFKDHPLLGVGLHNYRYLYVDYAKQLGLATTVTERSAHNLYLEVAAETGVVGLTVFLLLIWVAMKGILLARKELLKRGFEEYANLAMAMFVGILGYLVAAIFIHAAFPRYFYLLIGIGLSLPGIAKNTLFGEANENRNLSL
jgi:putative inorganic carbon (HCO3(-)) transporter